MKIRVLIFTFLFLSISGPASAGQETGPYLGGSLGYTTIDFEVIPWNFVVSDDNDFGFKVFAGYNFGLFPFLDLSIEGSYVDFGEASEGVTMHFPVDSRPSYTEYYDVGVAAWDLFGVACFNAGPVGIFGKAGQAWWDTRASMLNSSGNDMAFGAGIRFQAGSATIRVEYEFFDIDIVDVNFFSVGVSWTF